MKTRVPRVIAWAACDDGQGLLEYGLLASLIATFLIGSVSMFGTAGTGLWTTISTVTF